MSDASTKDYSRDEKTGVLTLSSAALVRARLAEKRQSAKMKSFEDHIEDRLNKIDADNQTIIALLTKLINVN